MTALAASPDGPSPVSAVITVTPVGNLDIALRSRSGAIGLEPAELGSVAAMPFGEKYDAARVRNRLIPISTVLCALLLAACGSEGVSVPAASDLTAHEGAEIFSTHCAGCHTISGAGTEGSGNRALRTQGPNFDQRVESYDEALFAIRNGGFSGAIMPQNIVTGDDATKVAEFLAKYSGTDVEESPRPTASASSETGEANASPNDVAGAQDQGDTSAPDADAEGSGGSTGSSAGSSQAGSSSGGGTTGTPGGKKAAGGSAGKRGGKAQGQASGGK